MKKKLLWRTGVAILVISGVMTACKGTTSHSEAGEVDRTIDSVAQDATVLQTENSAILDEKTSNQTVDLLTVDTISTPFGNLLSLKPEMDKLNMELVCGSIPDANNDSIILAFAGAYTGKTLKQFSHSNIAGDHVSGGKRYNGYRCQSNTGAFTWSREDGPRFFYKDYSAHLDESAHNAGMGFAQDMMIHKGKALKTSRKLDNVNVFRALCLDSKGDLVLFETQGRMTFGNFIEALLSQGITEALYTDMGKGWNYSFYRQNANESTPTYLHKQSTPYSTNFVVLKIR